MMEFIGAYLATGIIAVAFFKFSFLELFSKFIFPSYIQFINWLVGIIFWPFLWIANLLKGVKVL